MLVRVWWRGEEVFTAQMVWKETITQAEPDEPEAVEAPPRDSGMLSWSSSDPDDESHLVLRPEESEK